MLVVKGRVRGALESSRVESGAVDDGGDCACGSRGKRAMSGQWWTETPWPGIAMTRFQNTPIPRDQSRIIQIPNPWIQCSFTSDNQSNSHSSILIKEEAHIRVGPTCLAPSQFLRGHPVSTSSINHQRRQSPGCRIHASQKSIGGSIHS